MKVLKLRFVLSLLLAAAQAVLHAQGMTGFGKVDVQTDRDVYIAGETLLYRISLHDEGAHSGITYALLRDSHNATVARACIRTTGGAASGSIPLPDTLQSGVYQLVAFTNYLRNAGEESFFRKEIVVANLFDKELKAFNFSKAERDSLTSLLPAGHEAGFLPEGLRSDYRQGEEVTLKLPAAADRQRYPAGISVSVREVSPWHDTRISGAGEIKGMETTYLPETDGQVLRGKVVKQGTNQGISGCYVSISARDSSANMQYDVTDASGNFLLRLDDYYQGKEGYLSLLNSDSLPPCRIETEDKFSLGSAFTPAEKTFPEELKTYILRSQDIFRVNRSYNILQEVKPQPLTDSVILLHKLYDIADHVVYPSDFEPLTDFPDISREILPTVRTRRTGSRYTLVLADKVNHTYFNAAPALFVNGVYYGNLQSIMPWNSEKIRKIEVVNAPRVFGTLYFPGILSVVTNSPVSLPGKALQIEPCKPQVRLAGQPLLADPRIPDFRQLLYWDPCVQSDEGQAAQISFITSHHSGNFEICISAMDNAGNVLQSVYPFTVK